jgi:hypothetical protein
MFTADQDRAAAELLRVCRPGGHIALANWTPDGFIGHLFRTIAKHNPPPAGVASPLLWGTEAHVTTLLGTGIDDLRTAPKDFVFRYRSAEHFVEVFRTWYGPVLKAFAALGEKGSALETDLVALMRSLDKGRGKGLVLPSEYLEVVVTKR